MSWKLTNPDHTLTLDLSEVNGSLNGTLTFGGKTYGVSGGLAASAFGLSGQTNEEPRSFLAAIGTMAGPVDAPTQLQIQVDVATTADGSINHYQGELLPAGQNLVVQNLFIRRSHDGLESSEC